MKDKIYFSKVCLCRLIWCHLSVSSNGCFPFPGFGEERENNFKKGNLCFTFRQIGWEQRSLSTCYICCILIAFSSKQFLCQSGIFGGSIFWSHSHSCHIVKKIRILIYLLLPGNEDDCYFMECHELFIDITASFILGKLLMKDNIITHRNTVNKKNNNTVIYWAQIMC